MSLGRILLLGTMLLLAGCGGDDEAKPAAKPAASGTSPTAFGKSTKHTPAAATAAEKPKFEAPPAVEFQETDFGESERSRDPFRSFAKMFAEEARSKVKSQREVILDQYALDELRLVGIVTRIQPERALVVDPTGKGHIILRGQFVGRAEIVQGGTSGADYEINWRVERIRERDIVLVRDDPTNPDVPSATRIIALRADEGLEG